MSKKKGNFVLMQDAIAVNNLVNILKQAPFFLYKVLYLLK